MQKLDCLLTFLSDLRENSGRKFERIPSSLTSFTFNFHSVVLAEVESKSDIVHKFTFSVMLRQNGLCISSRGSSSLKNAIQLGGLPGIVDRSDMSEHT